MKLYLSSLFLLVILLVACTEPDLTPEAPLLGYSIIDGDTVKTRNDRALLALQKNKEKIFRIGHTVVGDTVVLYKAPKLHTPPAKDPDLSKLKNNTDPDLKGKPLRYLAMGSSVAAGVRDGGYFNEGIETSYPNLVARQMKLKKFEQPKFDAQDYNGVGRRVRTTENFTGGPAPKFKAAQNNTAVVSVDEPYTYGFTLKKYKGQIDNWSFPRMHIDRIDFPLHKQVDMATSFAERLEDINRTEKGFIYKDLIAKQKFDLFSIDLSDINVTGYSGGRPGVWPDPLVQLLEICAKQQAKGCIMNIPNWLRFPYYHQIDRTEYEQFIRLLGGNGKPDGADDDYIIVPSSSIDSLMGKNVNINLKPTRRLWEMIGFNYHKQPTKIHESILIGNKLMQEISSKYNYPIVDLYSLYEKILDGRYYTEDGVRVNPQYPNGNFFSSDGIYPTAFGQAIIANEVIKTINSFYKTDIPLIPTREYLK